MIEAIIPSLKKYLLMFLVWMTPSTTIKINSGKDNLPIALNTSDICKSLNSPSASSSIRKPT